MTDSSIPYNPRTPADPRPLRPAALPLMRPKQGRWLCGVCRGISLHLQVSVALVRLLFTAAAFVFGAGVVVYVFLWLTMPVGDPVAAAAARLNVVRESPLSRGNAGYGMASADDADVEAAGERDSSSESLAAALARAPKPALVAMAGLVLLTVSALMAATGIDSLYILPVMLVLGGLAVAWLWFNQEDGQFKAMLGGIALIVLAYMVFVGNAAGYDGASPRVLIAGGLSTMVGVMLAIVPWVNSLVRGLATERALKEREEERADMTAHLHDGVLQTLALIQMHADEPQTVFSLARQQERELRDWLYQDRTPSERSVNAGLKQIAAEVEDEHGKPIEVVTVGDARPSAQTDALLDAARQALVNAATHGGEPILRVLRGFGRYRGGVRPRPRQRLRCARHPRGSAGHPRVDRRPDQTPWRYGGDRVAAALGHRGADAYAGGRYRGEPGQRQRHDGQRRNGQQRNGWQP